MNGMVFDIQRMSVHDGPGIRTTVFLKGCPLNCLWCHNPESKDFAAELGFYQEKCTGCGGCAASCPRNCHKLNESEHIIARDRCDRCGACVRACTGALEIIGKRMTADEVIAEVRKDRSFYETSGGGVTFSGGEPFAQPEFLKELLSHAKRSGLHTCVETAGCVDWKLIDELSGMIDLFMYDFKESDAGLHKMYTGVSNVGIIDNLRRLSEKRARIVLCCPIIPGINDREEHFDGIAALANSLDSLAEIQIRQFNRFGESKSCSIGRPFALSGAAMPEDQDVTHWVETLRSRTGVFVRKN